MSDLLLQDLKKEIAATQVVVIVGTGVSRSTANNHPCASWQGLLHNGVDRCKQLVRGLPDGWDGRAHAEIDSGDLGELLSAAEKISDKLGAPVGGEYARWLRETVGTLTVVKREVIEALHNLGVVLATTNYDSLIEEVTGLDPVTWREGAAVERLVRGDDRGVLHLHGFWKQPESVILGIRSYEKVLGNDHAQNVLRAVQTMKTLLFVGCAEGLDDPNFGTLLKWTGQVFSGSEYRRYCLTRQSEVEKLQKAHPQEQRLFVLSYGEGFDDLAPFLRSLVSRPVSTALLNDLKTTPEEKPVPHNVEFPARFVPRKLEIGQVVSILTRGVESDRAATVAALIGAGGFGKTSLAKAVCYDDDILARYTDGVLWLTIGEGTRSIAELLTALLNQLGETASATDADALFGRWKEALRTRQCLVVLDDVWREADARSLVVRETSSAFLITTRIPRVVSAVEAAECEVGEMSLGQATSVLGAALDDAGVQDTRLTSLAERAGCWPLLLGLIAGQLRHKVGRAGATPIMVLEEVEEDLKELGLTAFDRNDPNERSAAVRTTIDTSLRFLKAIDSDAPRLYAELAVFPEDEPIPLPVLQDLWKTSRTETRRIAERLDDAGLAVFHRERGIIVHDVFLKDISTRWQPGEIQALHRRLIESWADVYNLPYDYAWRQFGWHSVQACESERLGKLLFDLKWLFAHLRGSGATSLIVDVGRGANALPSLKHSLDLLNEALEKSAHVLVRAPEQLAAQLFGRFRLGLTTELDSLAEQCRHNLRDNRLSPIYEKLAPVGSQLKRTLLGHEDAVSGALQLSDGRLLSWSYDHTLRLWSADGTPVSELRGHDNAVWGALQLSDGRLLSCSYDHTLRLWSADGAPVSELRGHDNGVWGALQLSDGRLLSWSRDGTLRLWSADGAPVSELRGHEGPVHGALQLSDGRLLSWSDDGTLRLWSAEGAAVSELRGHEGPVFGALLLSGGRLLSWSDDGTLRLWSAEGTPVSELRGHEGPVFGALLLSGGRLLSWSDDHTLRLWSADGAVVSELRGHEGSVSGALRLSDGRLLSWSYDHTLRLWSADGAAVSELRGHEGPVSGALLLNGGRLLSWSSENTLRLWSADGAPVSELRGHEGSVFGALRLSDGRLLSWSYDHTLRLWSADGAVVSELRGHEGSVSGALRLSDGRLLSWSSTWSSENTLRLWSADRAPVSELRGHEGPVHGALQLSDGRLLSWSDDGTLRLWSAEGAAVSELRGHEGPVFGALLLSDGRLLSWSYDGTLRLWSADGAVVSELRGHEGRVHGALQLSDGRLLSWSDDHTVRLWSAEGAPVSELRGHEDTVSGALQLSDGRLLSWSEDEALRLWSAEGAPVSELRGHEGPVHGALQLSDGRLLSWSSEKALRLWSAEGAPVSELRGHEGPVHGALQLSDGRLLSWSYDGTLRLWSADGTPVSELRGHEGRISGALQLSDGRLLSWSEDRTLRLWSHDGTLIDSLHFDAAVTTAVEVSDSQLFVGDSLGTVHWIKIQ